MNNSTKHLRTRRNFEHHEGCCSLFLAHLTSAKFVTAQNMPSTSDASQSMDSMRQRISTLESEVESLKAAVKQLQVRIALRTAKLLADAGAFFRNHLSLAWSSHQLPHPQSSLS